MRCHNCIDFKKVAASFGVPPPRAICGQAYSLDADMLFGWAPKAVNASPIPMAFNDALADDVITQLSGMGRLERIVYYGFRPRDSFELHRAFASESTYEFRAASLFYSKYESWRRAQAEVNDEEDVVHPGNSTRCMQRGDYLNAPLFFDSCFESGNLDLSIRSGEKEYDLYMRVDSNTRGHNQWFYFKVCGMKAKEAYTLNIVNFTKPNSLYATQNGLKPYVLSMCAQRNDGVGWSQEIDSITYKPTSFYEFGGRFVPNRQYYTATMVYTPKHDNDEIYFAYCIPYTYSDLRRLINELLCQYPNYVKESKLCDSLSGVKVPLLTITDTSDDTPLESRKIAIFTSRVHPGESNGSWMMHGLLQFLVGESAEAAELRRRMIFKVVPMLNPDGVICGNYRTSLAGRDLNRQFRDPDAEFYPTVYAIRELLTELQEQNRKGRCGRIYSYIDLHGHSSKRNVFLYGPNHPIHDINYYKARIFAKILADRTEMFRYHACKFQISKSKYSTARAVLLDEYMVDFSFTIEASFAYFFSKERECVAFNKGRFVEMGEHIGRGFTEFMKVTDSDLASYNPGLMSPELFRGEPMIDAELRPKSCVPTRNGKTRRRKVQEKVGKEDGASQSVLLQRYIEDIRGMKRGGNEEKELSSGSSTESEGDDLRDEELKSMQSGIMKSGTMFKRIVGQSKERGGQRKKTSQSQEYKAHTETSMRGRESHRALLRPKRDSVKRSMQGDESSKLANAMKERTQRPTSRAKPPASAQRTTSEQRSNETTSTSVLPLRVFETKAGGSRGSNLSLSSQRGTAYKQIVFNEMFDTAAKEEWRNACAFVQIMSFFRQNRITSAVKKTTVHERVDSGANGEHGMSPEKPYYAGYPGFEGSRGMTPITWKRTVPGFYGAKRPHSRMKGYDDEQQRTFSFKLNGLQTKPVTQRPSAVFRQTTGQFYT